MSKKKAAQPAVPRRVRLSCKACAKAGGEGACSSVLCPNRRRATATPGDVEAYGASYGTYRVPPRFNDN
jgi:hypothetical protein